MNIISKIGTLVLFLILLSNLAFSQVIAAKNGYQYTQADLNKTVRFTEFICGVKLSNSEIESLKQGELYDFNKNSVYALQNVANIDNQMQQFYALTDPLQVGLMRSMLIANLYYSIYQMPDANAFKQIFMKYNVVLALDPYNGFSFTEKDLHSYFDYLAFYAGLMGQSYVYDNYAREAYKQYVINLFLYGDNDTKTMLSVMSVYNQYVQAAYAQLSVNDKKQYANSLTGNYTTYEQGGSTDKTNVDYSQYKGSNMSSNDWQTQQMYFNTMQNIMTQQHATSLNIIENMGGRGNYWEVVNY